MHLHYTIFLAKHLLIIIKGLNNKLLFTKNYFPDLALVLRHTVLQIFDRSIRRIPFYRSNIKVEINTIAMQAITFLMGSWKIYTRLPRRTLIRAVELYRQPRAFSICKWVLCLSSQYLEAAECEWISQNLHY